MEYLVPKTYEAPNTPEVRALIRALGGPPEGYMCMRSVQEGERLAVEDERRASVLQEKLTKLRRLREERRA